jgi:CrcB protein
MPTSHEHHDPFPEFPVDPDVTRDVDVPPPLVHRDVVLAVAVGGALGSLGRWGVASALPHDSGGFPWGTVAVNVAGCFLIGVLMVVVIERMSHRRLVRPFFGTGVLGGFTTFSTYVVDTRTLVAAHRIGEAVAYAGLTLVAGFLAVVAGLRLTERLVR